MALPRTPRGYRIAEPKLALGLAELVHSGLLVPIAIWSSKVG
jgi:hypothetical protein